jgi:hypothetical protein
MTKESLEGLLPESWLCVDCGVNTAPGMPNRAEMEKAVEAAKAAGDRRQQPDIDDIAEEFLRGLDNRAEMYMVRDAVWTKARMEGFGGCLCIGCLEKRIGRKLRPKDFPRDHPFNNPGMPASPRLMKRRGVK